MNKKKIYIKIDKPIEVGDLVRCVRDDVKCKPGDVRKVEIMHAYSNDLFYTHGLGTPLRQEYWQPVRKLKVGDRVQYRGKIIMTVTATHPDSQSFDVEGSQNSFFATDQFTFYQPKKYDPEPVLGVDYGKKQSFNVTIDSTSLIDLLKTSGITTLQEFETQQRREFMERSIAEMVVELLDKGEWSDTLSLENYRSFDNSISVRWNLIDLSEAKLHPNDTWDTLTGVFVALSKATGRRLPDWIYGEV